MNPEFHRYIYYLSFLVVSKFVVEADLFSSDYEE